MLLPTVVSGSCPRSPGLSAGAALDQAAADRIRHRGRGRRSVPGGLVGLAAPVCIPLVYGASFRGAVPVIWMPPPACRLSHRPDATGLSGRYGQAEAGHSGDCWRRCDLPDRVVRPDPAVWCRRGRGSRFHRIPDVYRACPREATAHAVSSCLALAPSLNNRPEYLSGARRTRCAARARPGYREGSGPNGRVRPGRAGRRVRTHAPAPDGEFGGRGHHPGLARYWPDPPRRHAAVVAIRALDVLPPSRARTR